MKLVLLEKEFEDWNAEQSAETRRPIRNQIKEKKKEIKELYKGTNAAMIKYHQIKDLLEVKENYNIDTFIGFTFFKTANTYVISVSSFVENFWKITDKKSINEKDLDDLYWYN